jgi:hypothetical protein
MPVLRRILKDAGLGENEPDGRPLYALPMTEKDLCDLGDLLRTRLKNRVFTEKTGANFVLWAAEYIRSRFEGGRLRWEFVFQGLQVADLADIKHREDVTELVRVGLGWWGGRKVRESEAGVNRYLYTLMAEGGLPQSLLMQQGLYQRVFKGLLADLEAEGANTPDDVVYRIAARRVSDLPQLFQTADFVRLLAGLAGALIKLRAETPADVPLEVIDRWLDKNRPDWVQSLPLRLSREVADALIRPALRTERKTLVTTGAIAWRALVYDEVMETWKAVVRLADQGVLAAEMLSQATGLRVRLLPTGAASERAGSIVYNASPDEDVGWSLRRIGGAGTVTIPLALDTPFTLSAFADGRPVGEVDVVPATTLPEEAPSLWRPAARTESGGTPEELLPLSGQGRTRSSQIWLLTATDAVPVAGEGLHLSEPHAAPGGRLWAISGAGEIRVGEQRWQVATGAEEDPSDTLIVQGKTLPVWRLAGNGGHVFQGTLQFFGQRQTGSFWPLADSKIRSRPSRTLMGKIAEWIEQGVVQARSRYVTLPESARLVLRETGAGALELQVEALPAGISLTLLAGKDVARLRPTDGSGRLALSVQGAPPGIVTLRLTSAADGATLELSAPWPARNGMILSPDNMRLERDTPLAVDALRGWRAISPMGFSGEIQFRLDGYQSVAMRAEGEVPLAAHMPLIRSMLAHAGPDAQVHLSMITGGKEGRRLAIRRYHRQAHIEGCFLHLRDGHKGQQAASSNACDAVLRMVDLNAPEPVQVANRIEVQGDLDLRSLLPEDESVWLIQATVNDEVLRAVVWSPRPAPLSTRDERIAQYMTTWTGLLEEPDDPEWERGWKLIQAVSDGGDASVLDQVQALARVPAAAIELLLRVPMDALSQALALDMAAPIFWPVLPVAAFCMAMTCDYTRLIRRYMEVLEDEQESKQAAIAALVRRINAILTLRPELAGHFGAALLNTGLFASCMHLENRDELFGRILINAPDRRLAELAQDAARRFDRLPTGVTGQEPRLRPPGLVFDRAVQTVIDAPLLAAEIAAGKRPAPDTAMVLSLINLRLVDPSYFDSALPAALTLIL